MMKESYQELLHYNNIIMKKVGLFSNNPFFTNFSMEWSVDQIHNFEGMKFGIFRWEHSV